MTLPNFVFIGPDKSGSSWVHRVLADHPDIYMTPAKDTYFFDRYYGRGRVWYEEFFKGAGSASIVGEVCHDYLYGPEIPARMHTILGSDVRLMVCLREPIDRAYSAYLNMAKNGWDVGSFGHACRTFPELLDHGLYGKHLAPFVREFGIERILVTVFDDLRSDSASFYDGIVDWLGLVRHPLSQESQAAERAASKARSALVARTVKSAAVLARQAGLAEVVGRLKGSKFTQRLLYREFGEDRPRPTDVEREALLPRFAADVESAQRLTGVELEKRWGYA